MMEQMLLTREDISGLENQISEMRYYLKYLSTVFSLPTTVDVTDISKMLGVSRTQLKTKEAYLVPYFGLKGDFPDGTRRWYWQTWSHWNARPVEERKAEYEAYLDSLRRSKRKEGISR